jgi:hypothetical protein
MTLASLVRRSQNRAFARPADTQPRLAQRRRTRFEPQIRTCAACGRHTWFLPDDPAGGWFACAACGAYA